MIEQNAFPSIETQAPVVNPQPVVVTPQPQKSVIVPVLVSVLITSLLFVGGFFTYQYFQVKNRVVVSPAPTAVPTTKPTLENESVSDAPATITAQSPKPFIKVVVPSDWKKYTEEDAEFGIKTSLALPSGFTFRFTGSEFNISNDKSQELWEYHSSIYPTEDEATKNHYDGGSRRVWYENYLAEKLKESKIVSVKEIPLNDSSYLEFTVKSSSGDGYQGGLHYVFVQNKILHLIYPNFAKSPTNNGEIPKYIGQIFASLSSINTK